MNLATPSPPRPTLRRVKFAKKELVGGSLKIREFFEQGLCKMSCNAILVVFCGIISGYLAVPCSVPASATLPFEMQSDYQAENPSSEHNHFFIHSLSLMSE